MKRFVSIKYSALLLAALCYHAFSNKTHAQFIATMPERAYAYTDGVGVNIHLRFTGVYHNAFNSIIYPKLKQLGIKHVRDAVPYNGFLLPADTALVKSRMLQLYDSCGIRFSYLLDSRKVPDSVLLCDSARYLDVFRNTPDLIKTVQYFEGFNEPDLTIKSWYPDNWDTLTHRIQKALWTKTHAIPEFSGIEVVNTSAVGYWYLPSPPNRLAGIQPHISNYADYANFHLYDSGNDKWKLFPASFYDISKHFFDTIRRAKPWVVTELGYENALNWNHPTAPGYQPHSFHYISERAAGKYYSVLFMELFKRGARKVYTYEFIDQNTANQADCEQNFGLLRTDGAEKPAYTTIKNTLEILKDTNQPFTPVPLNFKLIGDTSGIQSALYQKSNGRYYLALWQGLSEGVCYDFPNFTDLPADSQRVKILLPFTAPEVKVYQPLHAAVPVYSYAAMDTIQVDVPDHLALIEIQSAAFPASVTSIGQPTAYAMTAYCRSGEQNVHVALQCKESGDGVIKIFATDGSLVATRKVTFNQGKNDFALDYSGSDGLYIVVFDSDRTHLTAKLIKQ